MNEDGSWELEWKFSPTLSKLDDKDIRSTPFRFDDGEYSVEPSESGAPTRIWRGLEEINYASKVDITRQYKLRERKGKLKFGGGYTYKQRDYEILNYNLSIRRPSQLNLGGNANELLASDNLWAPEPGIGTYVVGNFQITNTYDASAEILSLYVSNEMELGENFKSIIGLRGENFTQYYTGEDQSGNNVFDNEKVLDALDLFPSVNLIYSLGENINIRTSYSRTIARPSFKEASIAQIVDPLTGRTFNGGLFAIEGEWDGGLTKTRINNFDLRWEFFPHRSEVFSISFFYKTFDKPIELVQFQQAEDNFQPRNVGDGTVLGTELEVRKNLSFLGEFFERFSLNGNVSVIKSKIDMAPNEFESRFRNARDGETIKDTRDMQGLSPFLVNTELSYGSFNHGIEAGLFYNVQGRTLSIVGMNDKADVYSMPFHSLNFNASKSFGVDERSKISLGFTNILGQTIRSKYRSFGSSDKIFSKLNPGSMITVRYSHEF